MTYLPRIVDAELAELLEAAGAVLVEGPRASGKTATAARAAASEVLLDIDDNARRMIVPTGYGYVKPKEVGVIPVGTLGP
ncbi:MAG: hypothetical protein OXU81_06225 [Gammaproteobacteria bacterium]|nr:hypothetical protein [Gammaproteobacteria bacterium]